VHAKSNPIGRRRRTTPAPVALLAAIALAGCGSTSVSGGDSSSAANGKSQSSVQDAAKLAQPPAGIGKVYSSKEIQRCSNPTGSVKLGAQFELSGALVSFGKPSLVGAQLAEKAVDSQGGFTVAGKCYKLDIVSEDDRSDPTADVAAAKGLVNDQKVNFMIGPNSGVFAIKTQAITQAQDPPVLHISSTSAWQSQGLMGKPATHGLFRSGLEQNQTSAAFFDGLKAALPKAKSIYFFFRDDDTSAALVDRYLAPAARAHGLKIVGSDRFPPDTTDFSSQLGRIKSKKPDVLFTGYAVPDITAIARQASQLGMKIPIAGWGGGVSIPLKDAVSGPLNIPFVSLYVAPTMETPQIPPTKRFAATYAATGQPITSTAYYSLWYYDPVMMLVKAMQLAGSTTDRDAVGKQLTGIRWNGALGFSCWTKDHILDYGTTTALVENGKVKWRYVPADPKICAPATQ
jgi:branched-chain amino acid transport system substrate-binding protein